MNHIFIESLEISRLKQVFQDAKQGMLRCHTNMSRHLARTLVLTKCNQLQYTNLTISPFDKFWLKQPLHSTS